MRLSDDYECEIVEGSQSAAGAFDGIPFETVQAPIRRLHILDGNTGKPITKEQFKVMCRPVGARIVGGSYPQ